MGRRYFGRRDQRSEGRHLSRLHRQYVDQQRENDGTVPARQLRKPRNRDHNRRSQGLYQTVEFHGEAGHPAQYRPAGRLLRKREGPDPPGGEVAASAGGGVDHGSTGSYNGGSWIGGSRRRFRTVAAKSAGSPRSSA